MRTIGCVMFLWVMLATAVAFADVKYSLKPVGPANTSAYGINASGQVSGTGYIWDPVNGTTLLPKFSGQTIDAYCINSNGEIGGSAGGKAIYWSQASGPLDVSPASSSSASVYSINDAGQMCGTSDRGGVFWDTDRLPLILPNDLTFPTFVSNKGEVYDGNGFVCKWNKAGGEVNLGIYPSSYITFGGANDLGHVCGIYTPVQPEVGTNRGYIWTASSGFARLTTVNMVMPRGMNNNDVVIGVHTDYSYSGTHVPFIWNSADGFMDIRDIVSPADLAGWTYLNVGSGINDAGQIVGYGKLNGITQGFILNPVPEPAISVLLVMGFGEVLRRRASRGCV